MRNFPFKDETGRTLQLFSTRNKKQEYVLWFNKVFFLKKKVTSW